MTCAQCGSPAAEGSAACGRCGGPLVATPAPGSAASAAGRTGAASPDWPIGPGMAAGPGRRTDPGPHTRRGPGPAPGGPQFRFDHSRWSQPDRITGIATLVLVISLFMPWFAASSGFGNFSADAFTSHGFLFLVFLVALAIIVYLVMEAGFAVMPFRLPFGREQLLLVATGFNLLLVLIGFLLVPGGFTGGVGWDFGAFVGLIAAIVAFVPLGLPFLRARFGRR